MKQRMGICLQPVELRKKIPYVVLILLIRNCWYLHFITTSLVLILLLPYALLGLAGMPRRIPDYPDAI